MIGEVTGPQTVLVSTEFGKLTISLPVSMSTYRTIRKHPTVAITRAVIAAPVVSANWSVESDDGVSEDVVQFIKKQLIPRRTSIVRNFVLHAVIDFGWMPYEKVFVVRDGKIALAKVKPLLHDITEILVDPSTGNFTGLLQTPYDGEQVTLDADRVMIMSYHVEGTNWYGQPLLENVRSVYNKWIEADSGAERYDRKMAGTHWIVKYPPGSSTVDGEELNNKDVAASILAALESSGSVSVPNVISRHVADIEKAQGGWDISLLTAVAHQHSFVDREKYLDALIVRSMLIPERAVIEAEFGTKAEAGVHQSVALVNADTLHKSVTESVNDSIVNQLLELNWGSEMRDRVRLVASPIADTHEDILKQVYIKLLGDDNALSQELDVIDTESMKDSLGIPSMSVATRKNGADPLPGIRISDDIAEIVRSMLKDATSGNNSGR